MKNLLNDLTEKEKNSIREQHTGGMNVVTENFSKLINAKSGDVKPLVTENNIVEQFVTIKGPYNDVTGESGGGQLFIVRLDKPLCRYTGKAPDIANPTKETLNAPMRDQYYSMTGSSCPTDYVLTPSGKFYVQFMNINSKKLQMFPPSMSSYVVATNNGQGYATEQEAINAVSKIINPSGKVGRQVTKINGNVKHIAKYNRQGELKKLKIKSPQGTQKFKTGL
jgi:hypothetical protein